MALWKWLRGIGLAAQSIKGWIALVSLIPAIGAVTAGIIEQRPWSDLILVAAAGLAVGMVIAYYGILLIERTATHLTSRKEQRRISGILAEMRNSGVPDVDTPTIAAIWAGSREEGDLLRHVRFRQIKALIASGEIKNPMQRGPGKGPNIHTWVTLDELQNYFRKAGVIESD
ncbi:MAG: hypothetical protein ACREYB_11505 [Casimicrobiaceae bacterium]